MDYRIRLQVQVGLGDDNAMYAVDIAGDTPWGSTTPIEDLAEAIVTAQRKLIASVSA